VVRRNYLYAPEVLDVPTAGAISLEVAPAPVSGAGSADVPFYSGDAGMVIVPPGGFAGFAQMTPASQAMFQRAGARGGRRSAAKRRRKAVAKRSAPKRRAGKRAKRPARLVKGSAAAKKYMAKIRRKRKR
jgi:hypothetical protein